MNLFSLNEVVIIDMEVLSFKIDENVLIQFSARKYYQNKMEAKLNILIKQDKLNLNHNFIIRTRITPAILNQKGISLNEAKQKILAFIKNYPLISYKGNYFYFQLLWKIFDNNLKNPTIDIMDVAYDLNIISNNYDEISLEDLALSLGIRFNINRWNNASYDLTIIEKIWFKLKAIYFKKEHKNE